MRPTVVVRKALPWAVLAVVLLSATSAEARRKKPGQKSWIPVPAQDNYYLDSYFWSTERNNSFVFVLGGQSQPTPGFAVDFDVPFTFTQLPDAGADDPKVIGGIGDPTIAFRYVSPKDEALVWTVGGGLSAPLASVDDDNGYWQVADTLGYYTTVWDPHYWTPDVWPWFATAGLEWQLLPLFLRGTFEPLFLVPTDGGSMEIGSQERVEAEVKAAVGVGGGLALQAVTAFTEATDRAQTSAEAFFSYDDAEDFFMRLGVVVALDEQLGFGFDQGKVLTGHLRLGGYSDDL